MECETPRIRFTAPGHHVGLHQQIIPWGAAQQTCEGQVRMGDSTTAGIIGEAPVIKLCPQDDHSCQT